MTAAASDARIDVLQSLPSRTTLDAPALGASVGMTQVSGLVSIRV